MKRSTEAGMTIRRPASHDDRMGGGQSMKRFAVLVAACLMAAFAPMATAGDYHVSGNLVCSDCHVAHYSQSHGYTVGGLSIPLGGDGPYTYLLRNEVNALCLTCHDGQAFAPDVFGASAYNTNRNAGGLNAATGHRANDAGYDDIDGHTLWSMDTAPGGTFANTEHGLNCTNCHAQHGIATQYRNLLSRGIFTGKTLTYATTTNDLSKDVFQRIPKGYNVANVDYNEPNTTASAYANWCKSCHVDFHGTAGGAEVGGISGGGTGWDRHPQADVNIGAHATHISSLTQFNSRTNRVKVMDSQGLWDGTAADNTVTPSCFSCHKSHGNQNGFGLIFMAGAGATVTEEGDGGQYRDLCRQCHIQGA
jgi:hypothetical protein